MRVPDTAERALGRALDADCVGGLDLTGRVRDMDQTVLVCTTELSSRHAIDRLVSALAGGAS